MILGIRVVPSMGTFIPALPGASFEAASISRRVCPEMSLSILADVQTCRVGVGNTKA